MELSERFIQKLESEGFDSVYEWQDAPDTVHTEHSHEYDTAIYVTDGEITFALQGKTKVVAAGQRIDIPAGVPYTATVGAAGAIYIVGEKNV